MRTLVPRLVLWGLTRNPLRTCFLLLTVVGMLTSLVATGSVMYDLANRSIDSWRVLPFDIRVTGSGVGTLVKPISALRGVRQIDQVALVPLVLGARQMEAAVADTEGGLLQFTMVDGRTPLTDEEIVIDIGRSDGMKVGNRIEVAVASRLAQPISYMVCGISENVMGFGLLTEAGARRAEPQIERYSNLLLRLDPSASSAAIEQSIRSLSRAVSIQNYDEAQRYNITLNTAKRLINIVRVLSIVAGVGGFYMLVLLSQRERSHELGALRAVGFSQSRLILILLLEGCCIILVGTALAVFGVVLLNNQFQLGTWQTQLLDNVDAVLVVFVVCIGMTLLATFNQLRRTVASLIKG